MKYKIEFDICRETDDKSQDLIDLLKDDDCGLGNIEPFIGILWHVDEVPDHGNDNVWAITAETDDEAKKDDILRALAYDGYEDGVLLNGEYVDMSEYAEDLP